MTYRGREFDEHGRTVRGEDLYDSTRDQHYDRTKDPFSYTSVADKILDALAFEDELSRTPPE